MPWAPKGHARFEASTAFLLRGCDVLAQPPSDHRWSGLSAASRRRHPGWTPGLSPISSETFSLRNVTQIIMLNPYMIQGTLLNHWVLEDLGPRFLKIGGPLWGVFKTRALLFGVHVGALEFENSHMFPSASSAAIGSRSCGWESAPCLECSRTYPAEAYSTQNRQLQTAFRAARNLPAF